MHYCIALTSAIFGTSTLFLTHLLYIASITAIY